MLSLWPVPEACVKQLQSYWSTWLVMSSPTFVVFEAVSLLSVCETSSWWVEQRFGGYVPPCLDSNTWGHILTFASLSRQSHALCDEALWCCSACACSNSRWMRGKALRPIAATQFISARSDCFDLRCPYTLDYQGCQILRILHALL